jgi:uncharacterized protein YqeY
LPLRQRLKADLATAMREGDSQLVTVIRTLLGAIGNAEAVELDGSHPSEVQGWAEVPRRRLSPEDVSGILRREAEDLRSAAAEYEARGRPEEAARLHRSAGYVERYLAGPS